MYTKTILASAALLATTALAGSPGSAVIVNSCSYPVYLAAVPAAGGGHSESTKTLSPQESWSTPWTELSNGFGWSLKLSKSAQLSNILQYEYTYHNDGTIWYDLSAVDGNPWAGNWQVSSDSAGCHPRQAWYRFDTDDAFGMQDCKSESTIKVVLCSGEESHAGNAVSSVVAAVTQAVAAVQAPNVAVNAAPTTTTTPVAVPTTTSVPTSAAKPVEPAHPAQVGNGRVLNANVAPAPTTLSTVVKPTVASPTVHDDVVTEVVVVVETAIAYETYVPEKRHIHHPAHPHDA